LTDGSKSDRIDARKLAELLRGNLRGGSGANSMLERETPNTKKSIARVGVER
jgi:hypothetical protein